MTRIQQEIYDVHNATRTSKVTFGDRINAILYAFDQFLLSFINPRTVLENKHWVIASERELLEIKADKIVQGASPDENNTYI